MISDKEFGRMSNKVEVTAEHVAEIDKHVGEMDTRMGHIVEGIGNLSKQLATQHGEVTTKLDKMNGRVRTLEVGQVKRPTFEDVRNMAKEIDERAIRAGKIGGLWGTIGMATVGVVMYLIHLIFKPG